MLTSPTEIVCSPLKEKTPKKVVTQDPAQEVEPSETAVTQKTLEGSASARVEKAAEGVGLSFEVSLGPESVPPKPKAMMAHREVTIRGDLV